MEFSRQEKAKIEDMVSRLFRVDREIQEMEADLKRFSFEASENKGAQIRMAAIKLAQVSEAIVFARGRMRNLLQ